MRAAQQAQSPAARQGNGGHLHAPVCAGALAQVPGVLHGFCGRALGRRAGAAPQPADSRRAWHRLGVHCAQHTRLTQVHGTDVLTVTGPTGLPAPPGDGLVTTRAALGLEIWTADCLPILAADSTGQVVGAAHGGWRGLAAGIAGELVTALAAQGAPPARLRVALGPAIGPCCFRVGEEVAAALSAAWQQAAPGAPDGLVRRAGGLFFDLWRLAHRQLAARGVRVVETLRLCTACRPDFFSHRVAGARAGRQVSVILRRR